MSACYTHLRGNGAESTLTTHFLAFISYKNVSARLSRFAGSARQAVPVTARRQLGRQTVTESQWLAMAHARTYPTAYLDAIGTQKPGTADHQKRSFSTHCDSEVCHTAHIHRPISYIQQRMGRGRVHVTSRP